MPRDVLGEPLLELVPFVAIHDHHVASDDNLRRVEDLPAVTCRRATSGLSVSNS